MVIVAIVIIVAYYYKSCMYSSPSLSCIVLREIYHGSDIVILFDMQEECIKT